MSMLGIQFIMYERIVRKFEKAGALSEERAKTILEIKLDFYEESWLDYFSGSFLGGIKRTSDNRYYYDNYSDYSTV
jgi:hypothetical protein